MPKRKFYVVWKGIIPGVYDDWEEAKKQVEGFIGARYKSFPGREEAEKAFGNGYEDYLKKNASPRAASALTKKTSAGWPLQASIAVDAACSGNPGDMEYRGVYTSTGKEIFRVGPLKRGTNNIGEFLALVHGLALLKKGNCHLPIYSDSVNAIKWVKNKKSKTLLERTPENEPVFNLLERAEKWLKENTYTTQILKWETAEWGEIPADFGRK